MKDTNNGMVADVFKRIGMPTNPSCYETADQLHRAVLRAYFLGASDVYKEMEIEAGFLAHESSHICDFMCDTFGIGGFTYELGEPRAYICGWVANCIEDAINKEKQ